MKALEERMTHHLNIDDAARIPRGTAMDLGDQLAIEGHLGPNSTINIMMMAMLGEEGPRMRHQSAGSGISYCAMPESPVLATHARMASSGETVL